MNTADRSGIRGVVPESDRQAFNPGWEAPVQDAAVEKMPVMGAVLGLVTLVSTGLVGWFEFGRLTLSREYVRHGTELAVAAELASLRVSSMYFGLILVGCLVGFASMERR